MLAPIENIDRTVLLKSHHLYGVAAAWSEWQAEYAIQQKPVKPETRPSSWPIWMR
ncbi:MAG: hypothetical protein Q7U57_11465 [Methylovulum sp.]|nr:hypothetical protein [Methylovulum sp.]